MTIYIGSSYAAPGDDGAAFTINESGEVLYITVDGSWEGPFPKRFDTDEYIKHYGQLNAYIDILDIGYWSQGITGMEYEKPAADFRRQAREALGMSVTQRQLPESTVKLIDKVRGILKDKEVVHKNVARLESNLRLAIQAGEANRNEYIVACNEVMKALLQEAEEQKLGEAE